MTAPAAPAHPVPESMLRDRGVRVTAQRRLVLALLIEHEGRHFTADEVWNYLRSKLPEMARATAYNVLEELVRVGLAEELAAGEGGQRYGLHLTHHHHFVCNACQRLFDVHPAGVDAVRLESSVHSAFRVERVDIILRGLCPGCQADGD